LAATVLAVAAVLAAAKLRTAVLAVAAPLPIQQQQHTKKEEN
jgi:hypothetical protein